MLDRVSNKEIPKIDARHLSVDGQEELRLRGMKMLKAGVPQRKIATNLGICRSTVFKWSKLLKEKSLNEALKAQAREPTAVGKERQSALTFSQQAIIREKIIDETPAQLNFDFTLWTVSAIQELILRTYQVKFSQTTLSKYLKRWGFTVQRPTKIVYEQGPEKVRQWYNDTYPDVVARAKKQHVEIFWVDETSVQQNVNWIKNWIKDLSSVEQIPKMQSHESHLHAALVMISAVQNQGRVHFKIQKEPVDAHDYKSFLRNLVEDCEGRKIFVIADNVPIHHEHLARDWVDQNNNLIELYFLPAKSF